MPGVKVAAGGDIVVAHVSLNKVEQKAEQQSALKTPSLKHIYCDSSSFKDNFPQQSYPSCSGPQGSFLK